MKTLSVFFFLLFAAANAHGMCVAQTYKLLRWNPAGDAAVFSRTGHGPEGGGDFGYGIADFRSGKGTFFRVSSNFSPGNGGRPERIQADACRKAAAQGNEQLVQLGFQEKFSASGCASSRWDLFPAGGPAKQLPDQEAEKTAGELGLKGSSEAWGGPKGILLVQNNDRCRASCVLVKRRDKGKAMKLGSCEGK